VETSAVPRVDLGDLSPLQRAALGALVVADHGLTYEHLDRVCTPITNARWTRAELRHAVDVLVERELVERTSLIRARGDSELLRRDLIDQDLYVAYSDLLDRLDARNHPWTHLNRSRMRHARVALLTGRLQLYEIAARGLGRALVRDWMTNPLEIEHVRALPPQVRVPLIDELAEHELVLADADPELAPLLEDPTLASVERRALLAGTLERSDHGSLHAARLLQLGQVGDATKAFATALTALRKSSGDRDALLPSVEGALYPLALHLQGSASRRKQAKAQMARRAKRLHLSDTIWEGQDHLMALLESRALPPLPSHPLALMIAGLLRVWSGSPLDPAALIEGQAAAAALGWDWVVQELRALAGQDCTLASPLRDLREVVPAWELHLQRIESALKPGRKRAATVAKGTKRVVWRVDLSSEYLQLEARLQTQGTRGFSEGRAIALKTLHERPSSISALTAQDLRIASHLRAQKYGYRRHYVQYDWKLSVWTDLIGHPLLQDHEGVSIQVMDVPPKLVLNETHGHLVLSLEPLPSECPLIIEIEGAGFEVTTYTREQTAHAELIGESLMVPVAARGRLQGVLDAFGESFSLRDTAEPEVGRGHTAPVVQIWPERGGLRVRCGVRPSGEGPVLSAGEGAWVVLARQEGRPVRLTRDLQRERELADALLDQVPALAAAEVDSDHWILGSLDEGLAFMEQLQACTVAHTVEWPVGGRIEVAKPPAKSLSVRVTSDGDWFNVTGELSLDTDRVLELQALLAALEDQPGRFVRLDHGQFLSLTDSLRRQLDLLNRVGQAQGDGVQVHRLASHALDALVEQVEADLDQGWMDWCSRLTHPPPDPEVPATLKADLRPYQVEGFQWLARLTAQGLGACLADDMGLGKTLQTLALLLHRSRQGPGLVIAPTSVCAGWVQEAWRFAPTLTISVFGPGDRAAALERLEPGHVLVCSYGLLVTEIERLAGVRWSTVVLDEAQAIKNPRTQRHRAALALQADARVTLTGTPIENRLEELHAQLHFLNRGMLGNQTRFRDRFVRPVTAGERRVSDQLRRMVRPFLLRRTKSQVLEELPPRTEVDMIIPPDPESAAVYEALRKRAVASLESQENVGHVQVLAHMTKLRLAACSPRLVEGVPAMDGPKLGAFLELVDRLEQGNHRALVFSQFVKHLSLLRRRLDARGIDYQYLDGSVPAASRAKRVAAFQQGQGRLFLISLKAGGVGLNLTGADYVVHMDPWWNPAVEDQASDRAHRIGQTRAVTVYRMITAGTIEQHIVGLHRTKRDLADRFLTGAGTANRLSPQELLSLLQSPL
jgi:hypothetical protein